MAATSFAKTGNLISTTVGAAGRASGATTLPLAVGGGAKFPALIAGEFYRVFVAVASFAYSPSIPTTAYTIFKVTGVSGDSLTGLTVIEGTTDRSFASGDVVEVRITAGTILDPQVAVNALENTVVFTTGDQTIGGIKTFSSAISASISGNAGSVTNGVVTTGSYSNPTWITALAGTKLTGTVVATNGVVTTGTYSDPTWITALAGSKITGDILGNAAGVTGQIAENKVLGLVTDLAAKAQDNLVVHRAGNETISGVKTFQQDIIANLSGNAESVTNGVSTTGSYTDPPWIQSLSGTKITPFGGSGPGHESGAVPDPGATAGTTKFLCEDGNFIVPTPVASLQNSTVVLPGIYNFVVDNVYENTSFSITLPSAGTFLIVAAIRFNINTTGANSFMAAKLVQTDIPAQFNDIPGSIHMLKFQSTPVTSQDNQMTSTIACITTTISDCEVYLYGGRFGSGFINSSFLSDGSGNTRLSYIKIA